MPSASPPSQREASTEATFKVPEFIQRVCRSAVLPKTVTAFEASYLRRMNRIAQWFFCGHLPAFMLVAWANGTGVLSVALMTLAVLAVPLLGGRAIQSERSKSYVFAFTSMCMGGVLVHAGQGPVQIEMHFYFFSVLAMLALFANPMTVVVGAATVAVHHLALWYLAPSSVFNYDAPLWVVLVHASFVVLETFAAGFIARNFFDNVIGLEKKVEERTAQLRERNREMQTVLNSIEQGIVTVDANCTLLPEHSPAVVNFFGDFVPGESFADLLSRNCVATAEWFSISWESVQDGFLPLELALDQLPRSAKIGERSYSLQYKPKLNASGDLRSMLIVVSDVTSDVARQHAEDRQRELLKMLERAMGDPSGFSAFHRESEELLKEVSAASHGSSTPAGRRALHTMKGNAAAFGLGSIASLCHSLEDAWSEGSESKAASSFEGLQHRWNELRETMVHLLGPLNRDVVTIPASEVENMLSAAVSCGATELAQLLSEALLEPTSPVLARLETQAKQLASRLERAPLRTVVQSRNVRLPRGEFTSFWSALVHVIRNAIDHGIESPSERTDSTKVASGQLTITTEILDGLLVVAVEDDGRGIDWGKVRERAKKLKIPHDTHEDLCAALFAPEVSTRDEVSDISGRGIGLAVVADVIEGLNGTIDVTSEPGQGTQMRFTIPTHGMPCIPS